MPNQHPEESKTSRQAAIAAGLKIYEGIPCKKCSSTRRYVSSYNCVSCTLEKTSAMLYDNEAMAKYRTPEKRKEYREKNKEAKRAYGKQWDLKRKFGIGLDEYNSLLESQKYKCAICETGACTSGREFAVDHDHATGKIRGLLCTRCNIGLGYFKDSADMLSRAIQYLEDASCKQ